MEKIRLNNFDVIITPVKNSNRKWYFVLNSKGVPTIARVLPPEALEYGAKVTLENLSEEDIPRYAPQEVNSTEAIDKAIEVLEVVLSRGYRVQTNMDRFGFGWGFRTKAIKRQLGFTEEDSEYSSEGTVSSDIAEGKITLNYASMPIALEFPVNNTNSTEENEKSEGIIQKPKTKFEG